MAKSNWAASALALAVVSIAAPGRAENGRTGTTAGAALKVPAGARPAALGGAFVGVADDLNALQTNPAGLADLPAAELNLMHAQYLVDTQDEVLGLGVPLGALGTLAGSMNLFDYGSLPRNLERPDGLFGGQFGSTSPQDIFVSVGWGTALPPLFGVERLRAGASLKLTFDELSGETGVGVGSAAGILWDTPLEGARLGTLLDNVGALAGQGRLLPLGWMLGVSYATWLAPDLKILWAADTRLAVDTSFGANLGAEATAFDVVALRAGWRGGGALGGPTVGGGVRYPLTWFERTLLFKLDYAYATTGELDVTHRFQLGVQFGGVNETRRMGRIRLSWEEGEPVLRWKGEGPAYEVYVRRPGEEAFAQLTDRPLEEPTFALIGLPAGRYQFKIVTVDPYRPEWRGPASPEVEVDLEMPSPR